MMRNCIRFEEIYRITDKNYYKIGIKVSVLTLSRAFLKSNREIVFFNINLTLVIRKIDMLKGLLSIL